jgi:hypothetical protein
MSGHGQSADGYAASAIFPNRGLQERAKKNPQTLRFAGKSNSRELEETDAYYRIAANNASFNLE